MQPVGAGSDSEFSIRENLERAKQDAADLGGWEAFRSGDWLLALIQRSFRNYYARATSDYFQRKYEGRDETFIAKKLVSVAARNASLAGAVTGAVVSTDEIVALMTGGMGVVGLPANIAIATAAVMAESVVLLRIQMQLVAELAQLSGAPFDPEDPEDILTILAFALGGASAEAAGKAGMTLGGRAVQGAVHRYLNREVQDGFKLVGRRLGAKMLQRTLAKYAVPVASVALGAGWNYTSTRAVAKVANWHLHARLKEAART